jgi:hypothetical protein
MSAVANPILDRVFEPLGRCLTPAAARKLVALRADPTVQARIDDLAAKANEGQLTDDERSEYEAYVRAIQFVTVLQSKARRLLAKQT